MDLNESLYLAKKRIKDCQNEVAEASDYLTKLLRAL